MKTKIQIKSYFDSVLFEFEKEDNSIKDVLQEAVKKGADLQEADLQEADLQRANLRGADLQGADLQRVDLWGAYLQGADLQRADLRRADLQETNLRGADLQEADLQEADLRGANLQGAYLRGADLQKTNLEKIYNQNTILAEGELIVWKRLQNNLIAKLLIPTKAKRINGIGSRKCRFEYAKVIAIYDYNGKKQVKEGVGQHDSNLIYKKGEMVYPDKFDASPLVECSNGIHAFITRQEAEEY